MWFCFGPALCLFVGLDTGAARGAAPYSPKLVDPLTESWRWHSFPELKGRGLKCLEEGSGHTIWFGVDAGALRYDGVNWREFGKADGLPDQVISFARDGDRMFAATRAAIFALQGEQWNKVFPGNSAWKWMFEDLTCGSDGCLWAATNWGAIRLPSAAGRDSSSPDRSITLYTTRQIAAAFSGESSTDGIKTVVVATPERKRWHAGCGVYVYAPIPHGQTIISLAPDGPAARAGLRVGDRIVGVNGEDRLTLTQPELDAAPGHALQLEVSRPGIETPFAVTLTCADVTGTHETFRPYRIVEDRAGVIWFATRLGKLISYDPSGTAEPPWKHHTADFGLARVAVPSLAVTATGIAAVGRSTNTGALLRYDGHEWTSVELERRINSSVTATNDHRLLIGTNGGIISVAAGDVDIIGTRDHGLLHNDILVKQTSDNAIWVAGKEAVVLRVEPQGGRWTSYEGINYQAAGRNGEDWFISRQLSVVRRSGEDWRQFDTADGLMNVPLTILATRSGDVWVAGSHEGVAATARLQGDEWKLTLHPSLSWSIDRRAAFEDREGRVWFGAAGNSPANEEFQGGVVRFDGQEWKHFKPANSLSFVYGICQTRDRSVWLAGSSPAYLRPDDRKGELTRVPRQARRFCDAIASDEKGDLWLGTRSYGVFQLPGNPTAVSPQGQEVTTEGSETAARTSSTAQQYDESDGLSGNSIRNVLALPDRNVLASTEAGFDRFDGTSWNRAALPEELASEVDFRGLRLAQDDAIWINCSRLPWINHQFATTQPIPQVREGLFRTTRYRPDHFAPETQLEITVSEAVEGGAITVSWSGRDPWQLTPSTELTYSWRVDDGNWTPFSRLTLVSLTELSAGQHRFQVRARDTDFNVDASPAVLDFRVIPPLWRRTWFQLLLSLCGGLVGIVVLQSVRVLRHESSLRQTNQKLVLAERQLQQSNTVLEERVSQRTIELQEVNGKLLREIEERIQTEARLHESELRYRSIVEDQTEYIIRLNPGREIEFANDAFQRANGLTPGTPETASALAGLLDGDRSCLRRQIADLTVASPFRSDVVRVRQAGGGFQWEEWRSRALFNDDGQQMGFQLTGRDITELREAEARLDEKGQLLAHLARVSALGEMVAGISHEINQPLASIANFSAASLRLLERDDDSERNKENLREWSGQISQQIRKVSEIIKSLRRFGRPNSEREEFQIGDAVAEAILVTESRTRNVVDELIVHCPTMLPTVTADRIQIEQVLVNLIRNACDALESVPVGQRRISIEASEADNAVLVTVTDSGPGLSAEQADSVFDAFMTTKSDGMGIGLAISRSIIEAHDGFIQAFANAGGGQFKFSLPFSRETANC